MPNNHLMKNNYFLSKFFFLLMMVLFSPLHKTIAQGNTCAAAAAITIGGACDAGTIGSTVEDAPLISGCTGTFMREGWYTFTVTGGPLKITITHLSKDIKNNTIYFAVVDSKNTDLSYTDTQEVTLGENGGIINYSLPSGPSQSAPTMDVEKNGGIMEGICDGPTCGFNDLLKLFKNFWKFILIMVVPIIAIMTAWIGFNFMQSGAEYREKAKEMTWNMIKGLVLIIFAWFIVKTILDFTVGKDSCYSFLGKGKIDPECLEK